MTAPRVVLVDDTEDLRHLMRIALKRAGWEVVGEAGDGAAGIEVATAADPDLVILDLSMPVMDGLEALPHIRTSCPDATIVVMSGFGATQMTERALASGADGYLQKGTPLTAVVDYLGAAMARRGSPPTPEPGAVPAQLEPALTLEGSTTDLLTAAQARGGSLLIRARQVSPGDLVRRVVARRYDAEVVVEDDRPVRADPLRLEQMVSNLLSNAGTYGRPPVTVRVRASGAFVAIDVEDRGPGVPEHFRDRLFLESSRADSGAAFGTGLGLYVVRTLAEAHGGTASYAPAPEGGAVFTVTLPAG